MSVQFGLIKKSAGIGSKTRIPILGLIRTGEGGPNQNISHASFMLEDVI